MTTTVFRHDWTKVDSDGDAPQLGTGNWGRRSAGGRTKPVSEQNRMFIPPGWPKEVLPPCEPEWERSATAFLLDCCPADYRGYPLLLKQPVVLARLASQFVESQLRASRESIAQARSGLKGYVDAPVLDGTVDVLHSEEARLVILRRAVMLVEESLRGKVFISRL